MIGLLPLILTALMNLMSNDFTLKGVLASGEIFIALSVISASALGDLALASFPTGRLRVPRIYASGACLLCCVCNAVAYTQALKHADVNAIVSSSIALFIATIITSGLCVGMAAGR